MTENIAKIDKHKLDEVFRLTSEEDIYDFLKDEVYSNALLAKKIIKNFLPDDTEYMDLRGEVEDIFRYADENYSKWGPSMDWHQINDGLWRMKDKAKYFLDKKNFAAAVDIACQVITSVGKEYAKDLVFESESFDGDDFCTEDCKDMLIDIVEREVLTAKKLKAIQKEITKAAKMETYKDYCICDFDMLLCVLDGESASPEEHIKFLDERIQGERYSRDKNKWIARKSSYLQRKGMNAELESMVEANFGVPELSRNVIEDQISKGHLEKAIESLNKALEMTSHDEYSYIEECHKRRMGLYELTGNIEGLIDDCIFLVRKGYDDEKYNYYLKLKEILPADKLKETLRPVIEDMIKNNMMFTQKTVARICAEENETELLCACLNKNDSWYNNVSYELIKEYRDVLLPELREQIVLKHIEAIRTQAIDANSKHYSYIRYQMENLRDCCSEALPHVQALLSEFRVNYRRRPAFMKELERLDK